MIFLDWTEVIKWGLRATATQSCSFVQIAMFWVVTLSWGSRATFWTNMLSSLSGLKEYILVRMWFSHTAGCKEGGLSEPTEQEEGTQLNSGQYEW
jgi:hypothetical protein